MVRNGFLRVLPPLLAAFASLVVLSACGGDASTPTPTVPVNSDITPTPPPTSGASATRTVEHAMGTTDVPAEPERVVVLDMGELDMALALGVTPVGAAFYQADQPVPTYLEDKVESMTRVGTVSQPDLEAIKALDPDLILTNKTRHEAIYDTLSAIAPTVMAEALGADWKAQFEVVARGLGKTDEHQEIMDDYRGTLEEFMSKMGERLDETEVSIVRSFPDHVRIYMKASFIGTIIEDVGLPRPAPQNKDIFMERATVERIPDLDGDVIFTLYYNRSEGEQLSTLMDHSLWDRLDAVQNGRVYEMDDEVWGTGLGPTAAQIVIDDLTRVLVEEWQ